MPRPNVRLTNRETRVAEEYVSVLDFVSRCAQAIDTGNWFYLYDKAGQLERAAGQLRETAAENWKAIGAGMPKPRRDVMRTAVAYFGRHYRAARLLHPEGGGRR
jgi:hypothetical protein